MRRWLGLFVLVLLAVAAGAANADNHFGPPQVPEGFRIAPAVTQIHHPTRLVFGPDGRLYIAQQTGEILAITLEDGKEVARQEVARTTKGKNLLGIALKDDRLWVSETGKVAVYQRSADGTYTGRQEILPEIPFGLHQNDGFAWGPDGKLYLGVGSTTDRGPEKHPWSGTVLRMNPDGTEVEVFARGFRNPYGIAFDPERNLWVTDNGADDPGTSDELNLVVEGGDYGYPTVFEMPPPGSPTAAPVALFGLHNSTNGLAFYTADQFPAPYRGGLFVAMWGSSFDDNVGRSVGFVQLSRDGAEYQAAIEPFASGFVRPLDLTVGPGGDLWVGDFFGQTVYRIWHEGEAPEPSPSPEPASPEPKPAPQDPAPGPEPAPEPPAPVEQAVSGPPWELLAGVALLGAAGAIILLRRRHGR